MIADMHAPSIIYAPNRRMHIHSSEFMKKGDLLLLDCYLVSAPVAESPIAVFLDLLKLVSP